MIARRPSHARRRAGGIATLAAALLVLTAGVAFATTVTLKSKTVTLQNDDHTHKASATCALGTEAAGGGVKLGDDVNDFVQGSHPSSTDKRLWVGEAYRSSSESSTASFTTYALCIKGQLKFVSKKKTLVADNKTHTATATCPSGTKATGGGIQLGDNVNDYVQGTYSSGSTGWVAAGYRESAQGSDSTFKAWVVCLPAGKVTVKSKTFTLPMDSTTHLGTVKCGTAGTVTGGGVKLSHPDNDSPEGSYPAGKTGWTGAAYAYVSGSTFTVYAVCVK